MYLNWKSINLWRVVAGEAKQDTKVLLSHAQNWQASSSSLDVGLPADLIRCMLHGFAGDVRSELHVAVQFLELGHGLVLDLPYPFPGHLHESNPFLISCCKR